MAEEVYDDVSSVKLNEADRVERVEMMVDIYMSAEADRAQDASTQTESPTQQTGGRTGSRCSRWAVVWAGLLCVLLLIMTVVLYMYQRETLLSSIRNLTEERDQLNSSYQNLIEILHATYDDLVKLTKWRKNENSFYFFSTEQKTWSESRKYCRQRGADLVIINSREEQMFLINQKKERRFWIGLTDVVTEKEWKWVDDQPLTEKENFWNSGEPDDYGGKEDCASFAPTADGQRAWSDLPCSNNETWACEFNLTNFRLNTST